MKISYKWTQKNSLLDKNWSTEEWITVDTQSMRWTDIFFSSMMPSGQPESSQSPYCKQPHPSTSTSFHFLWTLWLCVSLLSSPLRHTHIKLLNSESCSRNHSPQSFKNCFFPLNLSRALNLCPSFIYSSSLASYFCSVTGKNSAS